MQKSKLGISVGLLGVFACAAAFFGGYLATFAIVGYILLCEENEWLRKTAVKAAVVMVVFSLAGAVVGFIPDAINLIDSVLNIFGGSFYLTFVTNIVNLCTRVLNLLEKIILVLLAIKAFSQGTVAVGPIDNIINKHLGAKEDAPAAPTLEKK